MGRRSKFTKQLGEQICLRIASGRTTLSVSKDDDMPSRETIAQWVLDPKKKEFSDMYARARDMLLEHWSDEIVEVSDDDTRDLQPYTKTSGDYHEEGTKSDNTVVNRAKLRVDSRKWLLSKLRPGQYGDKIQQEHSGNITVTPVLNFVTPTDKK